MRASRALRVSAPLAFAGLIVLVTAGACDKNSSGADEPGVLADAPAASAESSAGGPTADTAETPAPSADTGAATTTTPATTKPGTAEAAAGSDQDPGENTAEASNSSLGSHESQEKANPKANPKANQKANPKAKTSAKRALPAPIFGKGKSGCGRDPGVGKPIKSFSLKTIKGKTISSANLKGRVVLLNFWGTWCKPCLKELPEFDRLYRRYRKNGLLLLAIATDSDPAPVIALAKQRKLAAKIAIGGEELANSYKSPNFPFSFVVDKKGIIQASYRGFKPECLGQLEQDIRAQLGD